MLKSMCCCPPCMTFVDLSLLRLQQPDIDVYGSSTPDLAANAYLVLPKNLGSRILPFIHRPTQLKHGPASIHQRELPVQLMPCTHTDVLVAKDRRVQTGASRLQRFGKLVPCAEAEQFLFVQITSTRRGLKYLTGISCKNDQSLQTPPSNKAVSSDPAEQHSCLFRHYRAAKLLIRVT